MELSDPAFFGVLYTAPQRDLKRLLGYSSTENVGIAAMGFGVGCLGWAWNVPALVLTGFGGGILHLFNHALFKCLLFYGAGAVYRATHVVDLERLGGLAKRLPRTAILFLVGALAIAALPPLNGFVSELAIYSGLLSGRAPTALANVALVASAALLAFVGGVSALSMTRAFGVGFLGNPRDASLPLGQDPPRTMLLPMILHAGGIVLLGLAPGTVWPLFASSLRLFPSGTEAATPLVSLGGAIWASRALAALVLAAVLFARVRGARARRSVTWGCGYTATSARMQYTASGFAESFARLFRSFLPVLTREHLPTGLFPQRTGHLSTHYADPVEKRLFEVLGQGEEFIDQVADRLPESSRFAFAAGLAVIIVIGIVVVVGGLR